MAANIYESLPPITLPVGSGVDARRIAVLTMPPSDPSKPSLFWLSGFMSDMASTKATSLADWSTAQGFGMTRFDYSGHGQSGGTFTDGTIGGWLEETIAVFQKHTAGPQIVVGSSMGGYIALLLLRHLMSAAPDDAARILGLVLIAPAWDMTEELMWKQFTPEARRDLEQTGVYLRPSEYGAPYPIVRRLIDEGRKHRLAAEPFNPGRPVEILQGLEDRDVPAAHVKKITAVLPGGHVVITEVPDGEHRLSRPQDLALLYDLILKVAGEI